MTMSKSIQSALRFCLTVSLFISAMGCEDSSAALDDVSKRLDVVFPIQVDHRWGAINSAGEVLVEPAYDDGSIGFSNHSAGRIERLMGQQGLLLTSAFEWCFVAADGARRIKPTSEGYWCVYNLGESLFATEKHPEGRGYTAATRPRWELNVPVYALAVYDPFKKWNPPDGVLPVSRLSEGLIAVVRDGKFGYADRNGEIVVPAQCELADPFSDGLAGVVLDGKWGFIDRTGKLIIDPKFDVGGVFQNGLAMIAESDRGRPFFINKKGEVVSEWPYVFEKRYRASVFSEGLWCRRDPSTKRYGYSNVAGNWAITPTFNTAWVFSEGLAAVEFADSGEFGYIDKSGELRISIPRANHLGPFDYGLAWVTRTGNAPHAGYINQDGEWVSPLTARENAPTEKGVREP